ncbi:hypothetical protein [Roseibium album]|uniref:hypothetical protein n=1 Tax=Roseibium album TaxID=311410 RepID=UPI0032978DD6
MTVRSSDNTNLEALNGTDLVPRGIRYIDGEIFIYIRLADLLRLCEFYKEMARERAEMAFKTIEHDDFN